MDFLFNLISLLANLFSIEDHFKKDNDAKTVINNGALKLLGVGVPQ